MNLASVSERGGAQVCPGCGRSWEDARRTSLLGCPRCWDTFREPLREVLREFQGTASRQETVGLREQLVHRTREELERGLREALEREDYAEALRLRDLLNAGGGA